MTETIPGGSYLTASGQPVNAHGSPLVTGAAAPGTEAVTNSEIGDEKKAAAPAPVTTNADFTAIKGIGPARDAELKQLGITSFDMLANYDLTELTTAMEVSTKKLADWQAQAAVLTEANDGP